ncbi:MAG: UTP--glucose-1-phosphate uridylyltransferase GalU [Gemmatimonadetes bacterium]|nr:UTP--glucose-1-phosphate uridylyltransferase GalU [Gemmatimonadota bacterium]
MIRKAVIPAAGAGTRLLPATKAQPKEMLPILDTPAIQYVVQEAVDSGIQDILIVTGREKRAIEDHFDRNHELESHLARRGEEDALGSIRELGESARIHYIRQPTQAGLGDAVGLARAFVGDEPFAVLLGDSVMDAPVPVTMQLMEAYEQHRRSVIAVESVRPDQAGRYGIVEGTPMGPREFAIDRLVEKPRPGESDSNLAIAGRYVLTSEVFDALRTTRPGRNEEVQLTDALASMLGHLPMVAVAIEGKRFDLGNKQDYLRTVLAFALMREEYAEVVWEAVASLRAEKGES